MYINDRLWDTLKLWYEVSTKSYHADELSVCTDIEEAEKKLIKEMFEFQKPFVPLYYECPECGSPVYNDLSYGNGSRAMLYLDCRNCLDMYVLRPEYARLYNGTGRIEEPTQGTS